MSCNQNYDLECRICAASVPSFHSDDGQNPSNETPSHRSYLEYDTLGHRICAASASSFHSDDGQDMIEEVIETSVDQERSLKIPSSPGHGSQDAEDTMARAPTPKGFLWFEGRLCPRTEFPSVLLEFHDMFEGDGSQTPDFDTQWVDARRARDALRDNGRVKETGRLLVGSHNTQDELPLNSVVCLTTRETQAEDNSSGVPPVVTPSKSSLAVATSLQPTPVSRSRHIFPMNYHRAKKLLGMSWRESMRAKILYKDSQRRFKKDLHRFRGFIQ